MKILVVSNMYPSKKYPSYGIFVKNYCNQLEELGINYDTAVMKKGSNIIMKMLRYILFYVTTFVKCVVRRYDVVYIHYASNSSIPVLWANKIRKINVYTNVHGSDVVPENKKQEKLQKYTRRIIDKSTKVITPSEYFKEYVCKKYNVTEDKVCVSYSGGIDSKVFYKHKDKTKKDILVMGYVGRISYGKGWDTLLKACSHICEKKYKLLMVGSGPMSSEMDKLISELGIRDNIEIFPLLEQNKLRDIYNEIDVFVFPTEREGESLGLVAVEAMACGTPVIASDFAAPSSYVINGVNGYKFEKGKETDLASTIESFMGLDVLKREELSIGAIETAKKYEKSKVLEQMRYILLGGGL